MKSKAKSQNTEEVGKIERNKNPFARAARMAGERYQNTQALENAQGPMYEKLAGDRGFAKAAGYAKLKKYQRYRQGMQSRNNANAEINAPKGTQPRVKKP